MNQLYFLHIPKTAGSFINYSVSDKLNKYGIKNYAHQVSSNFPHTIDFDKTAFLGGHFGASPLIFNPNFYVACLLRNPLERSISYFNFTYHIYSDKYKDKNTYKEKLIKYLFNDEDTKIFNNIQSKFICNPVDVSVFDPRESKESLIEKNEHKQFCWFLEDVDVVEKFVKQQIDSFDIVGTVENIIPFCDQISSWFNKNYGIDINFDTSKEVNKTKYPIENGVVYDTKTAISILSDSEVASFKINNAIDYSIYDYVRLNELSR